MRGGLVRTLVRRRSSDVPLLLLWRRFHVASWRVRRLGPKARPGASAREMLPRAGGTLRAAAWRRAASRSCSSWRRWREDAPSEPPSERELYLRAELLECTARESPAPPRAPAAAPRRVHATRSCAAREGEYFYAAQLPGALTNRGGAQHVIRAHARPLPPRPTRATRAAGAMPQSTQSSRPRHTSSARPPRSRAPPRTPLPLPRR